MVKKIFSIQTISLIVAIFAAFFTYKAYVDNTPGQLTIELPVLNDDMDEITYIDASKIKRYFNLGFYTIPPVSINEGTMGGPLNMLLFPVIQNKTKRSFKDFTADIYIWSDGPMHQLFLDSSDDTMFLDLTNYTITYRDEYNIHLRYNQNILLPNRKLPYPINSFMLYRASDKISSIGGNVVFNYYLTYDGINEPISFEYNARMFYDNKYDNEESGYGFPNRFKGVAAYNYLYEEVFENTRRRRRVGEDGEWVFILQNRVYRDFKHLTSEEFKTLDDKSYYNLQNH